MTTFTCIFTGPDGDDADLVYVNSYSTFPTRLEIEELAIDALYRKYAVMTSEYRGFSMDSLRKDKNLKFIFTGRLRAL